MFGSILPLMVELALVLQLLVLIIEGVRHVPVTWNWQHQAHVGSFAHVAMFSNMM
jgi:hypothetical protein